MSNRALFWACALVWLSLSTAVQAAVQAAVQGEPGAERPASGPDGGSSAVVESQRDTPERLKELGQRVNRGFDEVRSLTAQVELVPESDREAVKYRRDERGFQLLEDLDDLARGVATLPQDDPLRVELTERLRSDFADAASLIFKRTEDLAARIAQHSEAANKETGSARLVSLAYVHGLKELRLKSYEAAANLIDSRRALGLPVDDIVETLDRELFLQAETLAGRLRFSGDALVELKSLAGNDKKNADLQATLANFSSTHQTDLVQLKMVSDLLARLGRDNADYRALILQQGKGVSVRDMDREVVSGLMAQRWRELKGIVVEKTPDFLFKTLVVVLVLLLFRVLARWVRQLVAAACERSGSQMSNLLKDVLASLSGLAVLLAGVFIALSQLGISIAPMLAGLGVVGFIVGFALQDTLGNFASGAMILLYRPYDVDDFVEVAGASGLVKKMSMVSTTIATFDNQTLVVPNSKIWGDVIKNVTAQKVRRVDLQFAIGYRDDVEQAERVLHDILDGHELVLKKPEPVIRLHSLGDFAVTFVVRPWVRTENYWDVYWDITREVKMRFDREGITIPYPQHDLHVHTVAALAGQGQAQPGTMDPARSEQGKTGSRRT